MISQTSEHYSAALNIQDAAITGFLQLLMSGDICGASPALPIQTFYPEVHAQPSSEKILQELLSHFAGG